MSSILDALRKIEDEKQHEVAPEEELFDEELAEDELFGRGFPHHRTRIELSPAVVFAGAGAVSIALLSAVLLVVFVFLRRDTDMPRTPIEVASAGTVQAQEASVLSTWQGGAPHASAVDSEEEDAHERHIDSSSLSEDAPKAEPDIPGGNTEYTSQSTNIPVQPVATISNTVASDAPIPPPRPNNTPSSVDDMDLHVRRRPAPQASTPVEPEPTIVPPSSRPPMTLQEAPVMDVEPLDPEIIPQLPILGPVEMQRLGLPLLQVNLCGPPTARRPRAMAVINYQKVFVGEYIPHTNVRLVGVAASGVAIELDGRKYYIARRR